MIWVLVICFAVVFIWLGLGIWGDLKSAGDIFDLDETEEEL